MFTFLLILQTLVAFSLVLVILMQRSEGGGLGVGGSSSGFMTARGAADFLTRATSVLGGAFIILSILLAAIAGSTRQTDTIDTSLARPISSTAPTPGPSTSPATPEQAPGVPLAQ
ncbi:MAG: preprotein translocase subunit SecG [Pseudomonadota bacterium]|nr:preprotein translocase subunit SecG [Pseudomonadota bacterium]